MLIVTFERIDINFCNLWNDMNKSILFASMSFSSNMTDAVVEHELPLPFRSTRVHHGFCWGLCCSIKDKGFCAVFCIPCIFCLFSCLPLHFLFFLVLVLDNMLDMTVSVQGHDWTRAHYYKDGKRYFNP